MCHCARIICSKECSTKAHECKTALTGTVKSPFFDGLSVTAAYLDDLGALIYIDGLEPGDKPRVMLAVEQNEHV